MADGILKVGQITTSSGSGTITVPSGVILQNNVPAFSARLSTGQSIANNTEVKITCNTEIFDTDNMYDNSTNYRFTPTVAGKYLFCHGVRANLTAARWVGWIRKNGTTDMAIAENNPNSSATAPSCLGSVIIDMNGSSDYVEYYCYQNSGGAITLHYSPGSGVPTYFQGYKIGV